MSDEIQNMKNDLTVTDDDRLWAALSLAIPIIGLVMLLIEDKKQRPFIKHAAVNGLAVAVATFLVSFVLGFIPIINCVAGLIGLGVFVYMIILAVTKTYNGEWVEIPYISDFVKQQGWV